MIDYILSLNKSLTDNPPFTVGLKSFIYHNNTLNWIRRSIL